MSELRARQIKITPDNPDALICWQHHPKSWLLQVFFEKCTVDLLELIDAAEFFDSEVRQIQTIIDGEVIAVLNWINYEWVPLFRPKRCFNPIMRKPVTSWDTYRKKRYDDDG